MTLTAIFWQAESGGSALISLLPLAAIFLVFYFLLILPNQRRQKKQQEMLASLKSGDRVITSGGILGTIIGVREKEGVIILRVPPDQVKLEVQRSAVATVERPEQEQ